MAGRWRAATARSHPVLPPRSTRSRLLGAHPVAAAVTYAALLWLPTVAVIIAQLVRDSTCLAIDLHARGVTPAQLAGCNRAQDVAVACRWGAAAAFLAFAALAARARAAARSRHALPGAPAADCALWLCCPPLALAQEARTAVAGGCRAGVWGAEGQGGCAADLEAPPVAAAERTNFAR